MKFQVVFKCPDAVDCAIEEVVRCEIPQKANYETDEWLPLTEEQELARQDLTEELKEFCNKWFAWGEVVLIELDTENGTAVVIPKAK